MKNRKVVTKATLEEARSHGTRGFPFQVYRDDYRMYPQGVMDLHWHGELEVDLLTEGAAQFQIDGKTFRLRKGDAVLVGPNVLHTARAEETGQKTAHVAVLFSPEFLAPADSDIYREEILPHLEEGGIRGSFLSEKIPWQREIIRLVRESVFRYEHMRPGGRLEIHTNFCTIWQILTRELEQEKNKDVSFIMQERTRKMLDYIRTHYGEAITVEKLADAAQISRSECFRCFQRLVGQKPLAYINSYRLAQAARLLRTTDLSVCEVGIRCGFNYQSYFGKMFRRFYGQTPFDYRKRAREGGGQELLLPEAAGNPEGRTVSDDALMAGPPVDGKGKICYK